MSKTLKEQTLTALFWNFMEKGGQQIFQFVFTFALLRLLTPKEFGLIAVLTVFMSVANIMQESGFASAIIRKKNADEVDYASVFYFNITISFLFYILFYISAPFIASFYEVPLLKELSRFLFLGFVFNSFSIIQIIHLTRQMNFKINARATLIAVAISGVCAVLMAYNGWGVWSLATQQVLFTFLKSLLLWLSVKWYPKASFSVSRIQSMFGYSSKLLINSLFNQISNNLYSMVIGKKFNLTDTGFYSQGNKLNYIPQSVIATTLQGVAFPLLNRFHDDLEYKKRIFRKILRIVSFLCFPVAIFIFVSAEPIVHVVLKGGEWLEVIPILRILAVGSSVIPMFYLLSSLLQSVGKSGLLLSVEFIRNVLSLITILFTVHLGLNAVVVGASSIMIIAFFISYHFAGKTIRYKISELLKDIVPYVFVAAISFLPTYFFSMFIVNRLSLLLLQAGCGAIVYFVILKILGSTVIDDTIEILKKKRK